VDCEFCFDVVCLKYNCNFFHPGTHLNAAVMSMLKTKGSKTSVSEEIHGRYSEDKHGNCLCNLQGRIQDFKLGGGGGLKKIGPCGGRRENCWGISCEKSRFFAKKNHIFSNCGGRRQNFGVFRVKNHDFSLKKSYFFQL
jgi:hypothetical protein